eukprot:15456785-Alexandrium_andersonii.AAC.1
MTGDAATPTAKPPTPLAPAATAATPQSTPTGVPPSLSLMQAASRLPAAAVDPVTTACQQVNATNNKVEYMAFSRAVKSAKMPKELAAMANGCAP